MSGGSYNYLYIKDGEQILSGHTEIREMSARLFDLAPKSQAARDCLLITILMDETTRRINELVSQLRPVFEAVEMADSNDASLTDAVEAISDYDGVYTYVRDRDD